MTLTIDINPKAVWDDGSPITVADFQCNVDAITEHPGSLSTTGYDKITSIEQGDDRSPGRRQVLRGLRPVQEPVLRAMIKAAAVKNCKDVSADFADNIPFSAMPYKIDSWSLDQLGPRPRTTSTTATIPATVDKVVMVPKADSDTEIASLVSGESRLHLPAGVRRHHRRAERPEHQVDSWLRHELRRPVLPGRRRLHA